LSGESKEAAINRHLQEGDITPNDVGHVWLMDDDFCESIDIRNYAHKKDLIRYYEGTREIQAWRDTRIGHSLGPPSLRPDFEVSIRRHVEIKGPMSE
jgi:hypothetical protein